MFHLIYPMHIFPKAVLTLKFCLHLNTCRMIQGGHLFQISMGNGCAATVGIIQGKSPWILVQFSILPRHGMKFIRAIFQKCWSPSYMRVLTTRLAYHIHVFNVVVPPLLMDHSPCQIFYWSMLALWMDSTNKPHLLLCQRIHVYGTQYHLTSAIQTTPGHFMAICEYGQGYAVLDDMGQPLWFPTFAGASRRDIAEMSRNQSLPTFLPDQSKSAIHVLVYTKTGSMSNENLSFYPVFHSRDPVRVPDQIYNQAPSVIDLDLTPSVQGQEPSAFSTPSRTSNEVNFGLNGDSEPPFNPKLHSTPKLDDAPMLSAGKTDSADLSSIVSCASNEVNFGLNGDSEPPFNPKLHSTPKLDDAPMLSAGKTDSADLSSIVSCASSTDTITSPVSHDAAVLSESASPSHSSEAPCTDGVNTPKRPKKRKAPKSICDEQPSKKCNKSPSHVDRSDIGVSMEGEVEVSLFISICSQQVECAVYDNQLYFSFKTILAMLGKTAEVGRQGYVGIDRVLAKHNVDLKKAFLKKVVSAFGSTNQLLLLFCVTVRFATSMYVKCLTQK